MSLQDLVDFLARIADDKGAAAADKYLKENLSEDQIRSSDWLAGMRAAFQYASLNEKRRLLYASQILGESGFCLPMEALFELGFPRREFIVNVDLFSGRLGDTLGQLARYLHAMHSLNLVLSVKPRMSRTRRLMLSSSCKFDHDPVVIDMFPPVEEYLQSSISNMVFNRSFLSAVSTLVLEDLGSFRNSKFDRFDDLLALHVRAGDALFEGALILPPLNYYQSAILFSGVKRVVVVSEPANLQDPCINPVPGLIQSFCEESGIDCIVQSSEKMEIDAATLFFAKRVVASNSSFSKWLPLYGDSCASLMIPDSPGGGDHWVQDECITYVDCWGGFDQEKWKQSLDYRLAWVSGYV